MCSCASPGEPLWGFLCGWAYFLITQTGGLAAVAAGFAALIDSVFRLGQFEAKLCAAAMLVALTTLNYYGVKAGARVNNLMTIAKVVGDLCVIAGAVAIATERKFYRLELAEPLVCISVCRSVGSGFMVLRRLEYRYVHRRRSP